MLAALVGAAAGAGLFAADGAGVQLEAAEGLRKIVVGQGLVREAHSVAIHDERARFAAAGLELRRSSERW